MSVNLHMTISTSQMVRLDWVLLVVVVVFLFSNLKKERFYENIKKT